LAAKKLVECRLQASVAAELKNACTQRWKHAKKQKQGQEQQGLLPPDLDTTYTGVAT